MADIKFKKLYGKQVWFNDDWNVRIEKAPYDDKEYWLFGRNGNASTIFVDSLKEAKKRAAEFAVRGY